MTIAVDICNTLAKINPLLDNLGFTRKKGEYHYNVSPEFFVKHPEIFSIADPIPGSIKALRNLEKEHKIIYLSQRPKEAYNITKKWLKQNGYPEGSLVLSSGTKAEIAKFIGVDVAIEDAPAEIGAYEMAGIPCYVFEQDYNTCCRNRFKWSDFIL